MEIDYNTNCFEGSWKVMLQTNYLEETIKNNKINFDKKNLWINNVEDWDEVAHYAQKAVDKGVLTNFYNCEDYIEEAMAHFDVNRSDKSLGRGYPYSVGSLCAIYNCKKEWMLYFTDDAYVPFEVDWIPETVKFIEETPKVRFGNLMWGRGIEKISWPTVKREAYYETSDYFVGYGFSDQCYLAKTDLLKNLDYNMSHKLSDRRFSKQRKPGTSFEKRIEAWKLNNDAHRATFKNGFYVHASVMNSRKKRMAK